MSELKAAGMKCIVCPDQTYNITPFSEYGQADYVVDNLGEIVRSELI